jgi:hypothetical protein
MNRIFTLIFACIISCSVYGQKLLLSAPFTGNCGFIEPELRPLMVKISETEVVSLVKSKGALNGPSDYLLEKYDLNLKPFWSVPVKAGPDEDFAEIRFNGTDVVVLAVIHEAYRSKSSCKAVFFNPADGSIRQEKVLDERDVAKWSEIKFKGAVRETFSECINSCLNQNFITPLEYQYYIRTSPDNKKTIVYSFDYSQKNLIARAKIFDKEFNLLSEGIIPIDNNFINNGIHLNNRGEVFILNVDKLGRIVVIQFNIATKDSKLLDIQYSNSQRESLVLTQLNDDVVYVANTNTSNGTLMGLTYCKFNFSTSLVEKIYYHEIPAGIRQSVKTARDVAGGASEDWKHYELTHFFLNEYEKIILILEKREIIGTNVTHDGTSVNSAEKWFEKMAAVNTKGVLMFAFNANDEEIWSQYYDKLQSADVNAGLLATSFSLDNSAEGKLRMVFSANEGAMGSLSSLRYVEWDEYTGNKLKELELENAEKVSMMKTHLLWWPDKLLFAGRKGIGGKKTFLNLYGLN